MSTPEHDPFEGLEHPGSDNATLAATLARAIAHHGDRLAALLAETMRLSAAATQLAALLAEPKPTPRKRPRPKP